MAPFSIFSSYKFMGSSIVCSSNPLVLSRGTGVDFISRKVVPSSDNFRVFSSCSSRISCSNFVSECFGHYRCRKIQRGIPRIKITASKVDLGSSDNKPDRRKKLSLRLRPKIRLILGRIKASTLWPSLSDGATYLRKNTKKVVLFAMISVAMGVCFLLLSLTSMPLPKSTPYSDFITSLQGGVVSKVLFEEGSRRILYNTVSDESESSELASEPGTSSSVMKAALPGVAGRVRLRKPAPEWKYSTRKIEHDESFLLSLMREKGTTYSSAPQSALSSVRNILVTIISLWIPLTPLMWLLHRQLSGGNGPARKRRPTNQRVCFDDVEGVDAAKEELLEIVSCLQGSINYNKLGAKLPRGVLLVGPPGTGKTLLARAVAGEAGVPFFSVSASEFVEMFVGRGAARIRDLFSVARKCEPSIVFIDELDAVGGRRGRSFNDERDQTLNQLLTEMDGFETGSKVIVVAATNRPEALDPALCRPGRFSRKVLVGEPDMNGRRKILAVHLRGIPIDEDPQLICNLVATLTPGLVGADLANIVNEAALLAARRGGDAVSREDVMSAIERAKYGIDKRQLTPSTISRGLVKLFPWMPSLARRDDPDQDGFQKLAGYQTLS